MSSCQMRYVSSMTCLEPLINEHIDNKSTPGRWMTIPCLAHRLHFTLDQWVGVAKWKHARECKSGETVMQVMHPSLEGDGDTMSCWQLHGASNDEFARKCPQRFHWSNVLIPSLLNTGGFLFYCWWHIMQLLRPEEIREWGHQQWWHPCWHWRLDD